mmetsp:Transcript_68554/g.173395  ORF Transcript_68554/g.173395 Transcript_68554/m.173395 type:complete len:84 (-) Transcript_68554:888-1139(-)
MELGVEAILRPICTRLHRAWWACPPEAAESYSSTYAPALTVVLPIEDTYFRYPRPTKLRSCSNRGMLKRNKGRNLAMFGITPL